MLLHSTKKNRLARRGLVLGSLKLAVIDLYTFTTQHLDRCVNMSPSFLGLLDSHGFLSLYDCGSLPSEMVVELRVVPSSGKIASGLIQKLQGRLKVTVWHVPILYHKGAAHTFGLRDNNGI
jgi:hypothetical protein